MPYQDPDLEGLFAEPQEREVVDLLMASRPAEPKLDPYFRSYLRDRLMAEARRTLPAQVRRSPWQAWTMRPLPAFAAMAAGFLVVVGVLAYLHGQGSSQPQQAILVSAPVANKNDVSVGQPIALKFSGPVDHTAVEESLEIQPATQYTTHWEGQTLVVIPIHQLAASTTYTVKLRPSPAPTPSRPSVSATVTPAPVPVVVRFVTAASPPPPVAQASWSSQNITFLGDTARLAEPGTFGSAVWTADGQLLVTRPSAGASSAAPTPARPSPNPSPAATPAAQPSASLAPAADLWLMDPQGTFVSKVASSTIGVSPAPVDGRFAFWRQDGDGHYALIVSSVAGNGQGELTVATLNHAPDAAPTWLGGSRLAYADAGTVRVVDIQGNAVTLPGPITTTGQIAGSRDGRLLAVQTASAILVYDLTHPDPVFTENGGTTFTWSSQGDLAFTVPAATGTQLWVQRLQAFAPQLIHTSSPGESWSDLNWSPDGLSLLFAAQSQDATGATISRAFLINADGTALRELGTDQYSTLAWSPRGDTLLFTRRDETGQAALWKASLRLGSLSETDRAQQQALGTVKTFMDARLSGDQSTAEAPLSPAALAVYQSGTPALLSPANPKYERWYPVTVQLVNPTSFLIGVRIVEASGSQEVAFFEERLTLALHDQRWTIDAVDASTPVSLASGGPSVVSVVVAHQDGANQVIQVRFDSDLAQGAITSTSLYVKDDTGNVITPVTLSYDQDNHLASLTVRLRHGHTYTLVVTTAVTDVNGHPLAQDYDSPLVISG